MSRFSVRAFKLFTAAGAIAATTPVALADSKKPSIYDDDETSESVVAYPGTAEPAHEHKQPDNKSKTAVQSQFVNGVRVRTSEFLEQHMNTGRKWLITKTDNAKAKIDDTFQRYLHFERSVTGTIGGLKAAHEEMLPGGIYVLISTLTGSILARNRNVIVRGTAPIVFGLGAFAYFLPGTFENTRKLTWRYEQKVPTLAEYHTKTTSQLKELKEDADAWAKTADSKLESGVKTAREFVEETTGLQIASREDGKKSK